MAQSLSPQPEVAGYKAARERIERLTEEVEVGHIHYSVRWSGPQILALLLKFCPHRDGLVHISQLDTSHVNKVTDVVKEGDEITVMVTNIDN